MSPLLSAQFWSQAAWSALCVTHLELQSDPVMVVALPLSCAYSEIAETRTATSNQAIRFIFPPQRELHRAQVQKPRDTTKLQSRSILGDARTRTRRRPVLPGIPDFNFISAQNHTAAAPLLSISDRHGCG